MTTAIDSATNRRTVTTKTKLLFWLMLAMFSTAFAEVLSGSFPLPFLNPAGPLLVMPVYGLHMVFALWAVYRYGRPRFATLYLAGVLFGMYEFILTKVLWAPPWGSVMPVFEIDWISFVVLALFWHPVLAFMIPAAIVELLGTSSRDIARTLPFGLASPSRRIGRILIILVALTHGALAGGPVVAFFSLMTTGAALWLITRRWRSDPARRSLRMVDLMPEGRQLTWLLGAMAVLYLSFGLFNQPWLIPGLGVVVAGLLYWRFVRMFQRASARAGVDSPAPWSGVPDWVSELNLRRWIWIYSAVAMSSAVLGLAPVFFGIIWIGGLIGVHLLWKARRYAKSAKVLADGLAGAPEPAV